MRDDVLLLVHSLKSQWGNYIKKHDYHVYQTLKDQNLPRRIMRKMDLLSSRESFSTKWLESWTEEVKKYKTIIVFAHPLYRKIVKHIRMIAPDSRIIVWYLDPYESCKLEIDKEDRIDQVSFDYYDCQKYGFKYSNAFYCYEDGETVDEGEAFQNTDVFFIGLDKGRYKEVSRIKTVLENKGITCDINIAKERWTSISFIEMLRRINRKYDNLMPYSDVIVHIKNSKALLDINQSNQSGVSQRPLEALLYNRKLITNNRFIKKMDFFNSNNIYVIENGSLEGIEEFISLPMVRISDEIKQRYTFEGWITQF